MPVRVPRARLVDTLPPILHSPAPWVERRPSARINVMVSSTKQSERRRQMRHKKAGRLKKKARHQQGTPPFSVQPEGYDPKAPDAKKTG